MRQSDRFGILVLVVVAAAAAAPAQAAVPFRAIASDGPLTSVAVGNEGSCQVAYRGDPQLEIFPPRATPADCGTFVFAAGALHGPDIVNHDSSAARAVGALTPFAPVSQSAVTGTGSAASPFRVVTVYGVGATGLRVTQTDSYVAGQEAFRTDVRIQNTGGAPQGGVLYRAADCYLQGSDVGYGFVEGGRAPGCSTNANNAPAARIEQWFPLTEGSSHMEAGFAQVWAHIGTHQPFPNSCRCTESIDNGAGLSWSFSVPGGGAATFSHLTVFSPTGVTGIQQQQPGTVPAFGPGGVVVAPSNRRCVSRRNSASGFVIGAGRASSARR